MGAVFDAEDLENGRRVALKVLSQTLDSPEARERFFREGRLAASINHPNSVYVFGTEEIGGTPVISMELVAGGTLQDRVRERGPLPVSEAVDCVSCKSSLDWRRPSASASCTATLSRPTVSGKWTAR